jgi:NAD dependent epimerase/dehydratase family enzyme
MLNILACSASMVIGGPLGTGKQWMSWIHREDLVELIVDTLQNPAYVGVFNATAPKPVRMAEFCSTLGVNIHLYYDVP